jgi:hypothetical protein
MFLQYNTTLPILIQTLRGRLKEQGQAGRDK